MKGESAGTESQSGGKSGALMLGAVVFSILFAIVAIVHAVSEASSSNLMLSTILVVTLVLFVARFAILFRRVRQCSATWPHWTESALEPERSVVCVIFILALLYVVVNAITGDDNPPIPESIAEFAVGVLILAPIVQAFVTKPADWRDLLKSLDGD